MPIVIKKRVSLEFLGEEYKDSYITFRSMPLSDYESSIPLSAKAIEEKKALSFMLEQVKKYFIGGKCIDAMGDLAEIKSEDLDTLDVDVAERCFVAISGMQNTAEEVSIPEDLKDPLTNPSTTEQDPPSS